MSGLAEFLASPLAINPDVLDAACVLLDRELGAVGGDMGELERRAIQARAPRRPVALATDATDAPRGVFSIVDGIATIPMRGVLVREESFWGWLFGGETAYATIDAQLTEALASVAEQILFDIDSPGGDVHGCAELAERIYAARKVKPITAFCDGQITSAAYYLGSAAHKVFITRSTIVGSIGVIHSLTDWSVRFHQLGIRREVIQSGQFKGGGTMGLPIDRETRAERQRLIDHYGAMFAGDVRKQRGFSDAQMSAAGEARMFVGQQAKDVGLIDGITDYVALRAKLTTTRRKTTMDEITTAAELRTKYSALVGEIEKAAAEKALETLAGQAPTTVEALEKAHPDLTKQLREKAAKDAGGTTASADQIAAAVGAERERCVLITNASFDGQGILTSKLIADGVKAVDASGQLKAARKGLIADSDTRPGASDDPSDADISAVADPREGFKADWGKSKKLQLEFPANLGGADAYAAVRLAETQGRAKQAPAVH